MTVTDVNEQLFNERRRVVESGGATRRDDGTWVYADKAEVFGREGLDMSLGQAALYSRVPAWHGLGTIAPEGTTDVGKLLELSGTNFTVALRPTRYTPNDDPGAPLLTAEDQLVPVRSDTGAALGSVGKKYHTIQNSDAFAFLHELTEAYGVPFESAGALRGGRRVFVSMRLPDTVTVDAEGINDEIIPFVVAVNSHDGSSKFECVVTPWRPVCANTERMALRDAHSRWGVRHTRGAQFRLEEARKTLGMSVKYYEAFAEEETQLARTELSVRQFEEVMNDLWPPLDDDAPTRALGIARNRTERLWDLREQPRNFPGTAYGAERAITEYFDHGMRLSEKGAAEATRLIEGADDGRKAKAHQRLMRTVR